MPWPRSRSAPHSKPPVTAGGFFSSSSNLHRQPMNAKSNKIEPQAERWYSQEDKTSLTDDERILDITPLPPPEHLIRFFPIRGTPMEGLIASTRQRIRKIMQGKDDRLLVVIGPCSIHDP